MPGGLEFTQHSPQRDTPNNTDTTGPGLWRQWRGILQVALSLFLPPPLRGGGTKSASQNVPPAAPIGRQEAPIDR
jgi:hypothetical protein